MKTDDLGSLCLPLLHSYLPRSPARRGICFFFPDLLVAITAKPLNSMTLTVSDGSNRFRPMGST